MERVNSFQPPKIVAFLGWKWLTLSSPQKLYHMKDRIKKYDVTWHHWDGKD
jgi:hypothetical protein